MNTQLLPSMNCLYCLIGGLSCLVGGVALLIDLSSARRLTAKLPLWYRVPLGVLAASMLLHGCSHAITLLFGTDPDLTMVDSIAWLGVSSSVCILSLGVIIHKKHYSRRPDVHAPLPIKILGILLAVVLLSTVAVKGSKSQKLALEKQNSPQKSAPPE